MEEKEIKEYFEHQMNSWDLARNNYSDLKDVKKKSFKRGDLEGYVQFNPKRAFSSLARLDKESIKKRGCFLCEKNRPKEQQGIEILPGWDLLVNPFPILPYHFTIVSKEHVPQKLLIETGKELASLLKSFAVFFNDDGAGASAPDHLHFQAAPIEEIPLINYISSIDGNSKALNFPFLVYRNEEDIRGCQLPQNVFFWKDKKGEINILGIPRKSHRPKEFFLEGPQRRTFSPGALDMAGVLVTPYEEDFLSVTPKEIERIYRQVGVADE